MFKPLRQRRINMGLNVTVHGSEQLQVVSDYKSILERLSIKHKMQRRGCIEER